MSKAQILRLINEAYTALEPLNNHTWTPYRDEIARLATIEEKQHRGAPRPGFQWGISVAQAARLFAVKRIAECMTQTPDKCATIKDVLHFQPSAIFAASVVANYREQIAHLWADFDMAALAAIDYAALVDGGQR